MALARYMLCAVLALGLRNASACSVSVPWRLYVNLVEMQGEPIAGLKWVQIYNIIDYVGDQRILVSGIRRGERFPIAKWQDGQECTFDAAGVEECHPNQPSSGVNLEGLFGNWISASDRRDDLKRIYLPLVIETGGREIKLALSSMAVRNTRKWQAVRSQQLSTMACKMLEGEGQ